MQKAFIFLLIIWSSSLLVPGNATDHLHFSLGCQAVIPCQLNRSDSFKWVYSKDEHSKTTQIYFQDKTGVEHHHELFRSRMKVLRNGSLLIAHFTEDDQGLYWCERCFQASCWNKPATVISVKKEILKETRETFYVIAGCSFTYACPGELTNIKWTFEASNKSILGPESDFVSTNKSIHIENIKKADAGKYTCWRQGCDGHRRKQLTIDLCVVTVHHSENSSTPCAVVCDVDFSKVKPNSTLTVQAGTMTIPVFIYPNMSLNCNAKQMSGGYNTVNSTHAPSNASNSTTDIPAEPGYLIAAIYGTSAGLACLILMALLICCLRTELQTAFPVPICCCGLKGRVEDETSVVYSSVIIRPAKTSNNHIISSSHGCVYSEIKV